jgi:uncharacterized membrane protein YbaN (DUF454 family)
MRILFFFAGLVLLGLGGAGAVLPLLPATPFVLLAAFCLGKSSPKLHRWFVSTRIYKNNLQAVVERKTMSRIAKLKFLLSLTAVFAIGFFTMLIFSVPVHAQILLVVVWALHILYFAVKIPVGKRE